MANLFIRPSQVVERLRDRFAYIIAKHPTFPVVKIMEATDSNLVEYLSDSDCKQPDETTLYVGASLSSGATPTTSFSQSIITGISLILCIGTSDEHAAIAQNIAISVKEAAFVSLNLWEWETNQRPLYFVTDGIVKVRGNAVLIRSYDYAHEVLASYTDVDDAFDLFDGLDDFTQLTTDNEFNTAPEGDIAELTTDIEFPGP